MRQFKYVLVVLLFFTVISCEKENTSINKNEEKLTSKNLLEKYYAVNNGDEHILKRDNTVEQELRNVFEGFVEQEVITTDFVFETGFPLWSLMTENASSTNSFVMLPTSIESSCEVSGIWYYNNNNGVKKIHYQKRQDFIDDWNNRTGSNSTITNIEIPVNTSFKAASFVQLQSQVCDIQLTQSHSIYIETRDGDEEVENDPNPDPDPRPCKGGEYVEVQVWVHSPNGEMDNLVHINSLLNKVKELKQANSTIFSMIGLNGNIDGASFMELEDQIEGFFEMNFDLVEYKGAMQEYLELRRELSLLGIGNGSDGILEDAGDRGGAFGWTNETIKVWVWCWDDPLDFDLTPGNGGSGNANPVKPDWWEDVKELQDCISVNDTHDVDGNSGGNEDASFTGDVDMCNKWNQYKENCLGADFDGVFASSYFQNDHNINTNPYYIWAQLKENHPELFDEIISGTDCKSTEDIKDILDDIRNEEDENEECLRNAISDFETEYDITLTEEEIGLVVSTGDCDEGFDDDVFYIINCVTKSNDYITVFKNTSDCDELDSPLSMSEDCKRLSNILDLVIGDDTTDPHCDLLKDLGLSKHDIQYLWDCDHSVVAPREDGTYPYGRTFNFFDTKTVKVYFTPEICDLPCIDILSVVIHESIHAKMESMALDKLPDLSQDADFPTSISFDDFQRAWNEIRTENFNGIINKHIIMAEYYTEQYAKAMYDMVGIGKWEDYLYWAYDGLGVDPPLLVGNGTWESHKKNWNSIKDKIDLNCE